MMLCPRNILAIAVVVQFCGDIKCDPAVRFFKGDTANVLEVAGPCACADS
jgi:hypothetical protein